MANPNDKPLIWNDPEYLQLRNSALEQMLFELDLINQGLAKLDPKSKEAGALRKESASARRAIRALGSEPYAIFGNELEKGLSEGGLLKLIGGAEASQRKEWQAVPGLHGHHRFPINSTWDPSSKMSLDQQVEGLKILTDRGYHLGNRGDKFLWLSGPAHVEGWAGRNDVFAHQAASGVGSDTKRFTVEALPPSSSGLDFANAVEPQIQEQQKVNNQSLAHPNEIQVRNEISRLSQRLGIRQAFGLEDLSQVKANNKAFKAAGFNATAYARDVGIYDWTHRLNAGLGTDAYEVLKANWRGAAMGAGLNLANPDTVKDIVSGNLGSAAQRAAQDTAIGVAGEQVAGLAAQGLAKVAPQAAAQILPRAANLAAAATPAGLTLLAAQGIQAVNDARVEAKARGLGMTAEQLRQKWRKEDTGAARQALGAASRGYRAGKRKPPAAAAPLITVNGKPLDIANELEYAGKQVLKIFGIGK